MGNVICLYDSLKYFKICCTFVTRVGWTRQMLAVQCSQSVGVAHIRTASKFGNFTAVMPRNEQGQVEELILKLSGH